MSVELKVADLSFDDSMLKDLRLSTGVDTVYGGLQGDRLEAVIRADAPVEAQALQEQQVQLFQDGQLIATQHLKSSERTGSRQIALSCRSDIEFMDSAGLGLLMGRYRLMKELGGTMAIAEPNERVMRILSLCGMERFFEISIGAKGERI